MKQTLLGLTWLLTAGAAALAAATPNVVIIYADDVGYGDVSCYGAKRFKTPNVDRLAAEGLRFTDAHSAAAVCTPSRYAMMTGEYAWRKKGTGILPGDATLIIPQDRATMASVMKKAGYTTGVVGKWHLGLGSAPEKADWNGEIKPGPLEIGFDYCFLIPATGDRVPCVFVENHRVVGLDPKDPIKVNFKQKIGDEPTGKENPELLKVHPSHGHDMTIINGISRIGWMTGGKAARWVDEDIADTINDKAVAFIEKNKDKPFFLYFATHDIHVPRVPHKRFVGKSGMGPRVDAILEFDDSVGRILDTLDRLKLTENTMVILTSDNGPVLDDGYKDQAVELNGDHKPAGPWRGGKGSNFEAGTRVPFIVRWPMQIKPGVSDALIGQVDFLATLATFTHQKLEANDSPDGMNMLPALMGRSKIGREVLIEQGRSLSIRRGNLKYIQPNEGSKTSHGGTIETGDDPSGLMFDLAIDGTESNDIKTTKPELAKQLSEQLQSIKNAGRSRG